LVVVPEYGRDWFTIWAPADTVTSSAAAADMMDVRAMRDRDLECMTDSPLLT
jgi:hypothetical protein